MTVVVALLGLAAYAAYRSVGARPDKLPPWKGGM